MRARFTMARSLRRNDDDYEDRYEALGRRPPRRHDKAYRPSETELFFTAPVAQARTLDSIKVDERQLERPRRQRAA